MKGVSIVIPAYNEIRTLPGLLEYIQKQNWKELGIDHEIIIVDDGSADGTRDFLREVEQKKPKDIRIILHEQNSGKGAAVQTGVQAALKDFVIIQDADLEYDPAEYNYLLAPLLKGVADVVYGSRFMSPYPRRIMLFYHYLGNKFLTFLTNIVANLNLTDMETGYKAFRREVIQSIKLTERDFRFEPEVTIKLAKKKYRFYEVGISYYGRSYEEGKKIRWTDGVKAIIAILKHGFFS